MIESVSITPVYNNGKNLEVKKVTGFGIFIECGIDDADKIFNLLRNITFSGSREEGHTSDMAF